MGCHHSVSCFKVVISWIAPFSQVSKSEMLKNLPSPTIFFKILLENQGKAGFTFYFSLKTEEKPLKKLAWKMPYVFPATPWH